MFDYTGQPIRPPASFGMQQTSAAATASAAAAAAAPASAAAAVAGGNFPEVDLSHLSEEERALIESVMVKAKQMEELDVKTVASARLVNVNVAVVVAVIVACSIIFFPTTISYRLSMSNKYHQCRRHVSAPPGVSCGHCVPSAVYRTYKSIVVCTRTYANCRVVVGSMWPANDG